MNFIINNNGSFGNDCNYEKGTCCMKCKYLFRSPKEYKEKWDTCPNSCLSETSKVRKLSCLKCKHKPDYMIK